MRQTKYASAVTKNLGVGQRYTYRVLQTIQMNLMLLWVCAEWAVLGRAKTALKFHNRTDIIYYKALLSALDIY